MSESEVPKKVAIRLWGKAAGRCEYEGCNEPLWLDSLTKAEFNMAYIAHIVADKPGGPRGDITLSEKLGKDITNLMLICDDHHRLIDKEDVEGHTVNRLKEMKHKHEERIELLTSIQEDKQSHVILYGANIGEHSVHVSWEKASQAMIPACYPAERRAIELSLKNSLFQDCEEIYWDIEREHLQRQFQQLIKPRLRSGEIKHFSMFAIAPQPLLIELGRLFSDIPAVEVYQLHREPQNWRWQRHIEGFDFEIIEPDIHHHTVALNLSLSATIDNKRISSALNVEHSIWTITIENPNNDFLKSRKQLQLFRKSFRELLNRIKTVHGEDARIHIFPAVPVSVAVEIGRVWMPKADLPMSIYDQSSRHDGFSLALDISKK